MKLKKVMLLGCTALVCLVFSSQILLAQGIKQRMLERLPVIKELKAKGIIGENNRGYLAFVTSAKAKENMITEENKDRKKVYTHIATQQGATLEIVEKRRAKKNAEKAEPGQFFQKDDGSWVKK